MRHFMMKWILTVVALVLIAFTVFLIKGKEGEPIPPKETSLKSDRLELPSSKSARPISINEQRTAPRFVKANIEKRIAKMGTVKVQQERQKIILTPEEVLARAGEPSGREGENTTIRKSLDMEEWDGKAHLLVEELNLGRGVELTHEQVIEFLNGDQQGWDSNYYRWIADELMTALREDMPDTTLDDLSSLVGNTGLDDAIRGYSLQHVGHLMDQGIEVEQGLSLMWESARGSDPDLKSTALVGLYQYAQLHPEQLDLAEVIELAEQSVESQNTNTATTAKAILKSIQQD